MEDLEKRFSQILEDIKSIFTILDLSPYRKCLMVMSGIVIGFLPDYIIGILRKKAKNSGSEVICSNTIPDIYSQFETEFNSAYNKREEFIKVDNIVQKIVKSENLKSKCSNGIEKLKNLLIIQNDSFIIKLIIPQDLDYDTIEKSIKPLLKLLPEEVKSEKNYKELKTCTLLINGFKEFYNYQKSYLEEILIKLEWDLGYKFVYITPCFKKPPDISLGNCKKSNKCKIPLCDEYFEDQDKFVIYYLPDAKKEILKKWIKNFNEEEFNTFKETFIQGCKEGASVTTSETFIPEFVDLENDFRIKAYEKKIEDYKNSEKIKNNSKLEMFINSRLKLEKIFLGKSKYLSAFPLFIKNNYFGMIIVPMNELTFEENWKLYQMIIGRIIIPKLIEDSRKAEELAYCSARTLEHFYKGAYFDYIRSKIKNCSEIEIVDMFAKLDEHFSTRFSTIKQIILNDINEDEVKNLKQIIEKIVDDTQLMGALGWKREKFEIEVKENDLKTKVREDIIRQILELLIRNVVKHANPNSVGKDKLQNKANRIIIKISKENNYAKIEFYDNSNNWKREEIERRYKTVKDYAEKEFRDESDKLRKDMIGYGVRLAYLLMKAIAPDKDPKIEINEPNGGIKWIFHIPLS